MKKFPFCQAGVLKLRNYVLGLCESVTEDKKLLITMHSLHTFKVRLTKLEAEYGTDPAYIGKMM